MSREVLWKYLRWVGIFGILLIIGYLLFRFLGNTISLLLISWFFAASISPLVEQLERFKISRGWAIGIIYSILFFVLVLTAAPAPKIILELGQFFTKLPELIKQIPTPDVSVLGISPAQIRDILQSSLVLDQIQVIGKSLASRTFSITLGIVNALGLALLTLLFTAYFAINAPQIVPRILFLLPPKIRLETEILIPPITRCLGAYVLGKLGTTALLGFLTYLVNVLLHVPYAGALGLLVSVTNLIPFIGPILGLIPMVIAAWNLAPIVVITVISASFTLQQLEAWVLQPLLVGPYLNLDPFELLLSIIVGAELGGVVGVLIAPPIAGTGRIIFNHFAKKYNLMEDENSFMNDAWMEEEGQLPIEEDDDRPSHSVLKVGRAISPPE